MNYDCDLVSVVLCAECTVAVIVVLTRSCRRADGNTKSGAGALEGTALTKQDCRDDYRR